MSTELCSYILQGDSSSTPFTRAVSLDGDRHLHVVAIGSLEGWGLVSAEFSTVFLDIFCRQPYVGESVLADFAQRAFRESLARHDVEYPPWSSVQYVAAFVDRNTLRWSWIGDMYLLGWNMGKKYIANSPHLLKGVDAKGVEQRAVLRSLGLHRPETQERQPEVGALHPLEHPTVLFLGNQDPETLLRHPLALQQVLTSSSPHEFRHNCNSFDTALGRAAVRGLFVYV